MACRRLGGGSRGKVNSSLNTIWKSFYWFSGSPNTISILVLPEPENFDSLGFRFKTCKKMVKTSSAEEILAQAVPILFLNVTFYYDGGWG